jgi:hypothetical protein
MKVSIKAFLVFSSILTIGTMLLLLGCSGNNGAQGPQCSASPTMPIIQSLSIEGL